MQKMFSQEIAVQLVGLTVQFQMPVTNAIGATARRRPEIWRMRQIGREIFEPENQRGIVAFQTQILNHGAVGEHIGLQTAASDGYPLHRTAIGHLSEPAHAAHRKFLFRPVRTW